MQPCQSLFVAPCSHVWHYKCIRPILQGPTAPSFLCPNCRAVTDLEADIDDIQDFPASDSELEEMQEPALKEKENAENGDSSSQGGDGAQFTPPASNTPLSTNRDTDAGRVANLDGSHDVDSELLSSMTRINISDPPVATVTAASPTGPADASSPSPHAVTAPVSIHAPSRSSNSLSPDRAGVGGPDCPMTPRNDVGPFVLDGSASRASSTRRVGDCPAEAGSNQ
jgi:E3 ubiquitin-protein ligase DMA1/2